MVSRWAALGMFFAVLALVVTSFSFAPVALADEIAPTNTSTSAPTTPSTPAPAEPTSTPPTPAPPTSTSKPPVPTSAQPTSVQPTTVQPTSERPAPAETTSEKPTTTSTEPTSTEPAAAGRLAARGPVDGVVVAITDIQVEGKPGEQAKVGDFVDVKGTWDASGVQPEPQTGDQFTVQFPDVLELQSNPRIDLRGDDGTLWGTCELVAATNLMTCTLTDAVADRPMDVKGDFWVLTKAVEYTEVEDVEFNINGEYTVAHALPGGGGIDDPNKLNTSFKKGELQPNKQSVRWTIDIPGKSLAKMDGDKDGTVVLSDALSANMKLCEGKIDAKLFSGRAPNFAVVDGSEVTVTQTGGAGAEALIEIKTGSAFDASKDYRVQYTSCTASDKVDPKGTTYGNSVTIDGKDVPAAGVGQDWEVKTAPAKSGVVQRGDRYMTVAWEIMIPGSVIAANPDHKVTMADALGGEHEVCVGGLGLKIGKGDYLPGREGQSNPTVDATGEFTIDQSSATAGAKSFEVTFAPEEVGAFEPDKYYYVTYQTCVTTTNADGSAKVPDTTDTFTNTVSVNGNGVPAATPTGPKFEGGKSGSLNTGVKTVGGKEQPAGTTIDWKVEVAGHTLEGLDAPAVITDTFSETLKVCEVGPDLKNALNLSVKKRDFLAGDDTLVDIAGQTTVATVDSGIAITLPKGAKDYSRDTRYLIAYTLCTASDGVDARGTVYGNSVSYVDEVRSTSSVRQEWAGGGTGQGTTRGSFSLLKQREEGSADFSKDLEFEVKVEEFAPGKDMTGTPDESYILKVKADGTPVSGDFARGNGWQIRLTEINLPTIDGAYFEEPRFAASPGVAPSADGAQAVVTTVPGSNAQVSLFNKAVKGSATIAKTVTGDAKGQVSEFQTYVINADIRATGDPDEAAERRQITLTDGADYPLTGLPIGATVTFSEEPLTNTDTVTWAAPVFSQNPITIGKDAAANAVTVTNEAKTTMGTFELSKKLTGPEASSTKVPETFDVVATWTNADGTPGSKTLTLPSDGTVVQFGESLPGGSRVTLAETVPDNGDGLAYGAPAYSGGVTIGESDVVTIGKDPRKVEVTNFIGKNNGTLQVLKQVSGEAADAVGEDVEFAVIASWQDDVEFVNHPLTVKKGKATPLGVDLPVGTVVTFTETARPDVAKVEWGTITWGTDPHGQSWLKTNADGSVTGIVSDDPAEGRLITLTNEALWKFGSVEFTKHIVDEIGENPVPATEAGLPAGAEFEVRIDGIEPALPAGAGFPAVGETIPLNAENGFRWQSGEVLPRNTVVTFSEVDPDPLPGIDWARPYYWVAEDAGDEEHRNTVGIEPGKNAVVEIHNRIIPTTDVDVSKIVTGPKGNQVTKDPSTTFQVTAAWTDIDDEARSCVLDVKPGGSVAPTAQCDAAVVDGKVQFPLNTEINFVESGAHTDVTNVQWGGVEWGVRDGNADVAKLDGVPTGATVTFTGEANGSVVLGLENETSSKGLIFIPIPIPLPPWGGEWPFPVPGPGPGPDGPVVNPGPGNPGPNGPGGSGHNGAPGKPAPSKPNQSSSLPVTGANVIWLAGAALVLIAGGGLLTLRNRRRAASAE